MTQGNKAQLTEVLRRFHGVLNTAWPKPGSSEMSGASVFIGTKLFKTLENGLHQIERLAHSTSYLTSFEDIQQFSEAFSVLFSAVARQDRNIASEKVDFAINLLYLASGVFYHRLAQPSPKESTAEMETFDDLLALCQWSGRAGSIAEVFNSLVGEMLATANDLTARTPRVE